MRPGHWQRLLLATIVVTGACNDEGSPQESVPVARVAQPLGAWTALWSGSEVPLHLGSAFTMLKRTVNGCDELVVLNTGTGSARAVPVPPVCASIAAAISDSATTHLYFANTANATIYRTRLEEGGTAGHPPATWSAFATGATAVTKLLLGSSHLYWQGGGSIYRAAVSGGTSTRVVISRTLLAVDGSTLYVERSEGNGSYTLGSVPAAGGTETVLYTRTGSFAPTFSLDANNLYWAEGDPAGGLQRLVKRPKSSSTPEELERSVQFRYESPVSNGTSLYWREKFFDASTSKVQRRSLATGAKSEASFFLQSLNQMIVTSTGVYVVGLSSQPLMRYSLQRNTL